MESFQEASMRRSSNLDATLHLLFWSVIGQDSKCEILPVGWNHSFLMCKGIFVPKHLIKFLCHSEMKNQDVTKCSIRLTGLTDSLGHFYCFSCVAINNNRHSAASSMATMSFDAEPFSFCHIKTKHPADGDITREESKEGVAIKAATSEITKVQLHAYTQTHSTNVVPTVRLLWDCRCEFAAWIRQTGATIIRRLAFR